MIKLKRWRGRLGKIVQRFREILNRNLTKAKVRARRLIRIIIIKIKSRFKRNLKASRNLIR